MKTYVVTFNEINTKQMEVRASSKSTALIIAKRFISEGETLQSRIDERTFNATPINTGRYMTGDPINMGMKKETE